MNFASEAEKIQFENNLESFKKQNTLKSTNDVFEHLFNSAVDNKQDDTITTEVKSAKTFDYVLGNSKHNYFICENKVLLDLVQNICTHQRNCNCNLQPASLDYTGHVLEARWLCHNGHHLKWESSSKLGNHHNVNYKMMSAYLCSGITQVQYEKLSEFAD